MHRSLLVLAFLLTGCTPETPAPARPAGPGGKAAIPAAAPLARSGEVTTADGAVLHYDVLGKGEPALVFVHGWCCNRSFWEPQLDQFAGTHRVVALDLAGHGESTTGRRKEWTMAAFGGDVAAVVKHLQLKRVVIVGHSMGGPVMLEAAALLPEEVVGLVGVDTFGDPDEQYTPEQMAEFRKPFDADFPAAMRAALLHEQDFFTTKTDKTLVERIVKVMTAAPPEVGRGAFQGMLDFANDRQRPLMAQVKVPFVCINAKRDPAKVAAGQKHAPQFDVVTLPDSGHFLMMEHPQEFNRLLAETLGRM